jgi:hypothetical protein
LAKSRYDPARTGILSMRGLLMAFFALEFPGHGAGRSRLPVHSTKTTAKTKTAKTV